ncbi:MAG TPA: ribonucleotide-diphosphate reductase subunit beta [Ktedonobacterales bacterium]|nr:ribonucleotide-diphosphate reductase subunit beta [Ktedonobacterales bacterium]
MTSELPSKVATEDEPDELDLDQAVGASIDLTRLYRLWEQHSWSAYALDFSQDYHDWHERLTPEQHHAARWNYGLFLHGEEAVARTLAPFVAALWTQEQRLFVTTQIVDEARHHVFFSRFMREVVGDGHDMQTTLDAAVPNLTSGFRRVFGELDRLTDRLRVLPNSRTLLAQSILLYHVIVEGMLAHPGQYYMHQYTVETGLLPGFGAGIGHVARDESRHMAFGVQVLAELVASSQTVRRAVMLELNRMLPWAASVFAPPGFDESYTRAFGVELTDVYSFALRSVETKLERIGISPREVASLVKIGVHAPVEEQTRRAMLLLRHGVLGDAAPLDVTDEVMLLLFDGLERLANMHPEMRIPGPIQWDFVDAPPWYLEQLDGHFASRQGTAARPALTLRCTIDDWARIGANKLDPKLALVTRRLSFRGDPVLAMRLPGMLAS